MAGLQRFEVLQGGRFHLRDMPEGMQAQPDTMAEPATELKAIKSAEALKLLYILVQDDPLPDAKEGEQGPTHRYTRGLLQSTLQLMGCKPRHATKISDQVFERIKSEMPPKKPKRDRFQGLAPLAEVPKQDPKLYDFKGIVKPKPLKKRSTTTIPREKFLDVVCDVLAKYHYLGAKQRLDLMVACRIREKRSSITVLLCGTSGCGKSTLATLLGQRLGVTTVVSTDSVRHMMRGFISEQENPLLWASTYHAGEFLDQKVVSEAIQKKREKMLASLAPSKPPPGVADPTPEDTQAKLESAKLETAESLVGPKVMAIEGFKAQSEMVMDSVDRLITAWETKRESVVVEGVHLSINFVMKLMKRHPSIIPFMVYIAKESKHMQRFAVRAKMMTLDPAKNKYVKYIKNIRTIQDYLCKGSDKHLIPKINNTNVDKSVAAIHATVFSCLRRRENGEPLLDRATKTCKVIHQEYTKQFASKALGSKSMFQLIQRKGSSRNLIAVVNADGTVSKAWPLLSVQIQKPSPANIFENGDVGTPVAGPFPVGSSEPLHLQFGSLGLSAFPDQSRSAPDEAAQDSEAEHAASIPSDKEVDTEEESTPFGADDDYDEAEDEIHKNEEGKSDNEPLNPVSEEDDEGSVDNDSVRSEGEDDFVVGEEDDAYWDYEESSPTPKASPSPATRAERVIRLRSFDRAAAGRGAPELRKTVSYSRASSRRRPQPLKPTPTVPGTP
ncbi:hypothetical protein M758_2G220600 [Ceratodon purpureus]|nr:hypothetical protein M758_2G220600 [Ceratodon purpureus]